MGTPERETAVGVFTDLKHAEQAIEELRQAGFPDDRIGFVADDPAKLERPEMSGSQTGKGATVGATVGGVAGAVLGLAAVAVVLPVAGATIAGGLLAGTLGGAVAGGTSGGVLGALLGMSVPEDEARHCEHQFHSGRSLVTVHAGDRYEEAVAILRRVAESPDTHRARHREDEMSCGNDSPDGGSVYATET